MVLALDLGGTKLAAALFSEKGEMQQRSVSTLDGRQGSAVGRLISDVIGHYLGICSDLRAIGVSVPGVSHFARGTVWAPNIAGWGDYPLREEIRRITGGLSVQIDSDRACCVLGERWMGAIRDCSDAIFLTVGTGIGAGILTGGRVLRGSHDIAGSIGWMGLTKPFDKKFRRCGCYEYYASGDGIVRFAEELLNTEKEYTGALRQSANTLTAYDVFAALEERDSLAERIIDGCIEFWGMATANLISILDPQKIVFGGGVFGPAARFLPEIYAEAKKWAQPVSVSKVRFEKSALDGHAALYGAGFLAFQASYLDINSN
jgi:glucokinase